MPTRGIDRAAALAALLVAALAAGLTIRANSFVPWGTDSGAYLSAAYRWADGDLFTPASFQFWAPWTAGGQVEAPLGHRPGPLPGTITPFYPLGYPLLLAAALDLGGALAPYAVAPLFVGVLVWCAFVLGRDLSGPAGGLAAALLIGATPVTLSHAMLLMSDVPAAACWGVAWILALRARPGAAAAAGCAAAMAMMIRPNLGPLAAVVAGVVLLADRAHAARALGRLMIFGLTAAIGPLMVLWSQAVLFGDPFDSGYPASIDFFFSQDRIPRNARFYLAELVGLHSWWVALGVVAVPVLWRDRGPGEWRARLLLLSALLLMAVNYALYLPYLSFDGWAWLRFLLPAMLALFVLCGAAADALRRRLQPYGRWWGVLAAVPVLWIALSARQEVRVLFRDADQYPRLQQMGHYLDAALPPNAVILTFVHSGGIALYTGRPVVRLDLIAADALDEIIADLTRHGLRPVFVLDIAFEGAGLSEKFKTSRFVRLDWPPRAEFATGVSVLYHDAGDRARYVRGDQYATDVLRQAPPDGQPPSWIGLVAPRPLSFGTIEELFAFRTTLEAAYGHQLRRALTPQAVPVRDATLALRRYLWSRVHGCAHETAAAWAGPLDEGTPPPCGRTDAPHFPGRDETMRFRQELATAWPVTTGGPRGASHVDLEGDAVWTQEYLQLRARGCSHRDTVDQVIGQVTGQPTAVCRPSS